MSTVDFILEWLVEKFDQEILQMAKKLSSGSLKELSISQLNGLSELAIHGQDVDSILKEVRKRSDKRWKDKDIYTTLDEDFKKFKTKANDAIADLTKKSQDHLGISLTAADQASYQEKLHRQLVKIYLCAAVEFARVHIKSGRD